MKSFEQYLCSNLTLQPCYHYNDKHQITKEIFTKYEPISTSHVLIMQKRRDKKSIDIPIPAFVSTHLNHCHSKQKKDRKESVLSRRIADRLIITLFLLLLPYSKIGYHRSSVRRSNRCRFRMAWLPEWACYYYLWWEPVRGGLLSLSLSVSQLSGSSRRRCPRGTDSNP